MEDFKVSERQSTKWRLFQERRDIGRGIVWCELCLMQPASDLHEVVSRVHYLPKDLNDVPDTLLALLCNKCNVFCADSQESRAKLLRRSIKRYGLEKVVRDAEEFASGVRGLNLEVTLWSLLR